MEERPSLFLPCAGFRKTTALLSYVQCAGASARRCCFRCYIDFACDVSARHCSRDPTETRSRFRPGVWSTYCYCQHRIRSSYESVRPEPQVSESAAQLMYELMYDVRPRLFTYAGNRVRLNLALRLRQTAHVEAAAWHTANDNRAEEAERRTNLLSQLTDLAQGCPVSWGPV